MKSGLTVGLEGRVSLRVSASDAIALGAAEGGAELAVFSTPSMINLMEHAARAVLGPFLEPGEESVGVTVQVDHVAPTPPGSVVTARAEVVRIDGRKVEFSVQAEDAKGIIGRGQHQRAIVRTQALRERLASGVVRTAKPGGDPQDPPPPRLSTLDLAVQGRVARLTLHRPQQRNALNATLTADLEGALDWLEARSDAWSVVIITGNGTAFCAGEDVVESAGLDVAAQAGWTARRAEVMQRVRGLPGVTLAAVGGPALGAGCVLAASCDFRLASTSAVFGLPEIKLGWPPAYGWRTMIDTLGLPKTLEAALLGETWNAAEAARLGFVLRTVPDHLLEAEVTALTRRLLALPAAALGATKRGLRRAVDQSDSWADVQALESFVRCRGTDDALEGIRAFTEKRPPKFRA